MTLGELKIEALRLMIPTLVDLNVDGLDGITDETYLTYLSGMIGSINRCFADLENKGVLRTKVFNLTYQEYEESAQASSARIDEALRKSNEALTSATTALNKANSALSALATLTSQVTATQTYVDTKVSEEATARQNADNTLTGNLNGETSARQSADITNASAITNGIATEQLARGSAIATETNARQTADANLQSQINNIHVNQNGAVQAVIDESEHQQQILATVGATQASLSQGYANSASQSATSAIASKVTATAQAATATNGATQAVEALNRVLAITQGIHKAIAFATKNAFLSWYNNGTEVTFNGQTYTKDDLNVGDDIYIKELNVSDLWYSGINETNSSKWWYGLPFTYLETDVTRIAEYTATCQSAQATATAQATSAGNSADSAIQSALSASASAGEASTSASNASTSASSAASSATAAEGEVTKAKAEVVKAETQVSLATAQANIATDKAQEIASSAATISQHSTEIAELKTRVETLEDIQELDINKIQQVVRGGVASKYIQVGDVISTYKETSITANIGLSQGITAVSIDSNIFMSAYGHSFNGEVMFIYDDSKWYLHEEEINISTYGLTITGSARNGDEIIVHETSSKLKFDVMDFDTETPSDTTKTHSLPLMLQDVFSYGSLPFCNGQLMYWARDGLSAGTYYFRCYRADYNCTNNDYYMQFTITQDIEAGGGLKHNRLGVYQSNSANYSKDYMLGGSITTYSAMVNANGIYTRPSIETVSVTEGQSGTYLGCFSAEFYSGYTTADALHNATRRNGHGNNRWDTSYHRQWLNSSVSANVGWYTPKSNFDMPPSEALQKWAGFLNGIDADFVNAIGTTKQKCATGSWDRGMGESDYYITEDKIFYASMTNMNRGNNNGVAEGSAWKYWRDHNTNADRIKYQGTTARYWWLRSCRPSDCGGTRYIYTSGAANGYAANGSNGVVPACVII